MAAALGTPSPAAIKRLQQEMKLLRNSPTEGIVARPDEANILLWHYVLTGPKGTPYEGGTYLDYHPKEWNPVWNVSTILTGLLSFMVSEDITAGSMESPIEHKKLMAKQSHAFNVKFPTFKAAFPELVEEEEKAALAANPPPPPPAASNVSATVSNDGKGGVLAAATHNHNNGTNGLLVTVWAYSRRGIIAVLQLSVAVVALAFVVLMTM